MDGNYDINNYSSNKSNNSNSLSGVISLLLIGIIVVIGLMAFNVIDNPLNIANKDDAIVINTKNITIDKGGFYQLEVSGNNGMVYYESSNSKIAEVNQMTGFVIGNSSGTATITAYLKDNPKIKDECVVTVEIKESTIEVSKISLSSTSISLNVGSSKVLTYKVIPTNANIKKIYWSTSDSSIATVDKNGLVTGKKVGTATINIRTENGSMSKCKVLVTNQTTPTPTAKFTLTYNANGGNLNTTSKKINSGSEYGSLPIPTRSGYTFNGWYTEISGGAKVYSNTKITGNTTIYAHWTKNGETPKEPVVTVYTLTYNANGGNVNPINKKLNNGSVYGSLPTPTRSGYTFDGWYTAASGGTKVSASTKITGNVTIYAHWNKNSTPKQDPNSISLNCTSLALDGGSTHTITATLSPSNVTNKKITWSSSNARVAKVDSNGKVTANVAGESTITATTSNGKTASCNVKVTVNITYHEIRYAEDGNSGTTIWYAVIPKKYKMHFAYGKDVICGAEKPSDVAKRLNATIAVNSQLLGFPVNYNGQQVYCNQNVSGYDFTIKQNPNFSMNNINTSPCDALLVTATTDFSQGISFKDVNLGFEYEGDHVKCYGGNFFLTLFAQLVQNRSYPNKFSPVPSGTEYFNRYYTQQETRQHQRIPRTWIAYDSQGNQFVAVATGRDYPLKDGRKIGQAGLTYHEMIKVTQKYFTTDIVTMYNMDGGGSATFVYKGEKLNGNGDVDANGNRYERDLYGTLYW